MSRTPHRRLARIATGTAIPFGLAGAATTVARSVPVRRVPIAPDTWVMFTSFSDFGIVSYAVAAVAALVGVAGRRGPVQLVVGALVLTGAVVHGSWLLPRYLGGSRTPVAGAPKLTVLSLNMKLGGAEPDAVDAAAADADLVVLTEATKPKVNELAAGRFGERFRYRTPNTLPWSGASGTAVFSRYPLDDATAVAGLVHQTWSVRVELPDGAPVTVLAVHPGRPYRGGSDWAGDQQRLRAMIPPGDRTIVSGDFNAVDSHLPIRALRSAGYVSSSELAGAGWQPTYPADERIPALIEIDHVLLAPGLTATSSRTVRVAGSDHLGVLATITSAR